MSDVNDRYVIDQMAVEDEKLVLIIVDPMEWGYCVRESHAHTLKDKISDYLQFIDSGQAAEYHKDEEYNRIVIRVAAKCSYSNYGLDFLERCQKWIQENGHYASLNGLICKEMTKKKRSFRTAFQMITYLNQTSFIPVSKRIGQKLPLRQSRLWLRTTILIIRAAKYRNTIISPCFGFMIAI